MSTDDTFNTVAETGEYLGCRYCLGGFVPAGTNPILGLVYQTCLHCQDRCRCCESAGVFPADSTCIHCLIKALANVGMTPVFCHTCSGVIAVYPPEAMV
jgi:hypothetical protein